MLHLSSPLLDTRNLVLHTSTSLLNIRRSSTTHKDLLLEARKFVLHIRTPLLDTRILALHTRHLLLGTRLCPVLNYNPLHNFNPPSFDLGF